MWAPLRAGTATDRSLKEELGMETTDMHHRHTASESSAVPEDLPRTGPREPRLKVTWLCRLDLHPECLGCK